MTLTGRPFEPEACGERISKNLKQLYTYSTVFDDEYTKNLFEKTGLFTSKLPSKVEILSEFESIKKDLFFDLFYYKSKSQEITKFK
jgi:glutamine synthetase type III